MVRKIIKINEALCNGCGLCAKACHEGAIEMVNGKAKLVHEHYCDGLGDCLPSCPVDAISFEEREAPAYDEAAVKAAQKEKSIPPQQHAFDDTLACGCPGSMAKADSKRTSGSLFTYTDYVPIRKSGAALPVAGSNQADADERSLL